MKSLNNSFIIIVYKNRKFQSEKFQNDNFQIKKFHIKTCGIKFRMWEIEYETSTKREESNFKKII